MQKNKTKERVTIKGSLGRYGVYLESNGKSKSTVEGYMTDANQFYNFIRTDLKNRIRYADQLTSKEVELYKQHLLKKIKNGVFKPATVEKKYSSLKVYFHFLATLGLKDLTLGDKLGNKKTVRDMYGYKNSNLTEKILTEEQIDEIFDYLYEKNKDEVLRDRAFFELLRTLGCRRSELLALKWEDIKFNKKEILITRDKTSNSSELPLTEDASAALTAYYKDKGYMSEYVFHASQNPSEPMPVRTFNNIIKSLKRSVGLPESFSSGWFRHTFITTCLRNGISAEKTIRFTGHSKVTALDPYIHLVTEDLESITALFERRRAA